MGHPTLLAVRHSSCHDGRSKEGDNKIKAGCSILNDYYYCCCVKYQHLSDYKFVVKTLLGCRRPLFQRLHSQGGPSRALQKQRSDQVHL